MIVVKVFLESKGPRGEGPGQAARRAGGGVVLGWPVRQRCGLVPGGRAGPRASHGVRRGGLAGGAGSLSGSCFQDWLCVYLGRLKFLFGVQKVASNPG